MITIVCKTCGTAVRVCGEADEVDSVLCKGNEWYPDRYPCPKQCGGTAELFTSIDPLAWSAIDVTDVTLQEAFAAFHGLGLPEERDCGPVAVTALMLGSQVKSLDVKLLKGSNRSIIYSIEFENGERLYLGASPYGALVYRRSTPRKITDEVLRENADHT